jgi:hypothetical protein
VIAVDYAKQDVHLGISFNTYWPADYVSRIRKAGDIGSPLKVVFGGGDTAFRAPSIYGAKAGDVLFPVTVLKKSIHVIGRLEISEIIPIENYIKDVLKLPKELCSLPLFDLTQQLLIERPALGHRAPHDYVYEAAIGYGSRISMSCIVPPESLDTLRLVNQKGEARAVSYISNGQIHKAIGLQGHCYRLCDRSAALFSRLVEEAETDIKALNRSGG